MPRSTSSAKPLIGGQKWRSKRRQKRIFHAILFLSLLLLLAFYLRFVHVLLVERAGMLWRFATEEPARFDLFLSSAFNLPQNPAGHHTLRVIGLATYALRDAPVRLFCRSAFGETVEARRTDMGGPEECEWHDFFVDCDFQVASPSAVLMSDDERTGLEIHATPVEQKRTHSLVVCYPRMFFFENWPIALLSIELYRHFGVELFSIPVISVLEELFAVLQHYERHGIVRLKHGVVLPMIRDTNPNAQTDFLNQMIHNHECLYEFQRSAEFVIFADIDDVIVPREAAGLVEELRRLALRFPLASSFEFLWARFNVPATASPADFNIEEVMSRIYRADGDEMVGKSAVRPERMLAGVMHRPFFPQREIAADFTHMVLDRNSTRTIHLRSRMERFEDENRTMDSYFDFHRFDGLTDSFHWFLSLNHAVYEAFLRLPTQLPYFRSLLECAQQIDAEMTAGGPNGRLAECPNPLRCERRLRSIRAACVVVEHTYEAVELGTACRTCVVTLHKSAERKFVKRTSCALRI